MPRQERFTTKYEGVYYVMGHATATGKPERIFYIRYRRGGKLVEEKAGRQFQDDMTPARAARVRAQRIEGDQLSNTERRAAERAIKEAEQNRWTFDRLWTAYRESNPGLKGLRQDQCRYDKYVQPHFGDKEVHEVAPLDLDRLRVRTLKTKTQQTVKHVLALIRRLARFGCRKGLCPPLGYEIEMPSVHNEKIEDLSPDQLARLLEVIDRGDNVQASGMMKMALYSGLRRGEMFRLRWADIDFHGGFVLIRDPKGGRDQRIPLSAPARQLLENHPRISEFVFPGREGKQRTDVNKAVGRIKAAAGLPEDFRALHGLRHVYASMLASSGQVDLFTLQKLLTHKSPAMTQRYAHLRDETLRRAADLAGEIITTAAQPQAEGAKVVNLAGREKA